jgi:acyl-CoA thioesterase
VSTDTGPHQVELDEWISCAPFERFLGITIVFAEHGEALLTMAFSRNLAQGAGLMHGGALVSLADTAAVMAIKSLLAPGTNFATRSLECTFLRPVMQGSVDASAIVTRLDERRFLGQSTILDHHKRTVLQARMHFSLY